MTRILVTILLSLLFGCDNTSKTSNELTTSKTQEIIYSDNINKLKELINLTNINVIKATWTTGEKQIKGKIQSRLFDIDLDANQWWLHAAVTTDSDLSFIKTQCNHDYTLQMKTISPKMEISKLTDSPLFNGNDKYKIYEACTLYKSPLNAGVVALDEKNGVLLMLLETSS